MLEIAGIAIGVMIGAPLGVITAHLFFNYCVGPVLEWIVQ